MDLWNARHYQALEKHPQSSLLRQDGPQRLCCRVLHWWGLTFGPGLLTFAVCHSAGVPVMFRFLGVERRGCFRWWPEHIVID